MSWVSNNALRVLRTHAGVPVAPQVAAQLDHLARGDQSILRELADALTPDQLRGGSALPDPLPFVPSMRSDRLDGLAASERRVLLLAALSRTQRLDDLLDAAAVEIDVLLFGDAVPALAIENGRVQLVDERLRAEILHFADPFEQRRGHEALARAGRRRGAFAAATWHTASAMEPKNRAAVAPDLVRLAESHLAGGDPASAQRVARAAVESTTGEVATRAWTAAGLGAFWCGHFDDAESWLKTALRGRIGEDESPATAALGAIPRLLAGPDGSMYSRSQMAETFRFVLAAAPSRADRDALTQFARIADVLFEDPRLADSLQAQLFLTTSRNRRPDGLGLTPNALSPQVEAHVSMMQVALQSQADERAAAAVLLLDVVERLPVALSGNGVAASYVRILSPQSPLLDEDLADALDSISSRDGLRFDGDGSKYGHDNQVGMRAAAASRLTSPRRQLESPSVSARHPLSARQNEVVRLLGAGLSNKEIGAELRLSPRTIEVHLTQIYRKYEVRSRSELMSVLAGHERRRR